MDVTGQEYQQMSKKTAPKSPILKDCIWAFLVGGLLCAAGQAVADLMMRTGLRILGVHSEDAVMIGDRMDTDMVAGIETGLDTVLVLSGVTRREDIAKFPYRPRLVLDGVGDIPGPAAE